MLPPTRCGVLSVRPTGWPTGLPTKSNATAAPTRSTGRHRNRPPARPACSTACLSASWLEEEDPKAFFEFRINVDELTNNVILEITDYAESDEKEDCVELWNKQVATLKRRLGS